MKVQAGQEKSIKSWESALADAKQRHAEGRSYVSRMRRVIRLIERKVADGERFPSDTDEQEKELS